MVVILSWTMRDRITDFVVILFGVVILSRYTGLASLRARREQEQVARNFFESTSQPTSCIIYSHLHV